MNVPAISNKKYNCSWLNKDQTLEMEEALIILDASTNDVVTPTAACEAIVMLFDVDDTSDFGELEFAL